MLRSFKLCVLFVNNRSTISLFYDGSVDLISFVRDTQCSDMNFEGILLPVMSLTGGSPLTQFLLELTHYTTQMSNNFLFNIAGEKQLTCCSEIGFWLCSSTVSSNVMVHSYFNSAAYSKLPIICTGLINVSTHIFQINQYVFL